MRRTAAGALVVGTLVAASASLAGPPAPLEPLAFLIGEWEASGGGTPGPGTGRAVFARTLQDRVILRTSYAEFRADYYDSEGHVIRYAVTAPAAGQAVFVSEPVAAEPRYRLSYRLAPDGILEGEFAIAPPGEPPAFKPYLAWKSRRARAVP